MHIFSGAYHWFLDPAHWHGPKGVPVRILEHVEYSGAAVGIALVLAIPVALYVGHTRRGELLAVSIANLGRAIPSFAILSIVFQVMLVYFKGSAFGFWPTVIALFLLGIPPILTNTYVGIQNVDPDVVEAARGQGMSEWQVLRRLELPLAMPLIAAGVRIATLQVIATATLAALIAGGGLGVFIVEGFALGRQGDPMVVAGAVLVALLAIITEVALGGIEKAVRPRTSSKGGHAPDEESLPEPVMSAAR
jgi:osmoprotectant transport system permease protein